MPIDKIQRWLDLLAFLTQRHYPVTRAQIMEGVPAYSVALDEGTQAESVRRTFERDKRELLEAGIPLETVDLGTENPDEQVGYLLRSRDFYLPYLRILRKGWEVEGAEAAPRRTLTLPQVEMELDDLAAAREAAALLRDLPDFPLAAEAASAYRKLTFDLAPAQAAPPAAPLVARDDPEEVSARTTLLARAMERGKAVTFRYAGAYRDATTDRRVHPYGLLFKFNHWYLVGHDLDRQALRIFRLSRMDGLAMNTVRPGSPDFTRPEDFSLEPWRNADPWSLPGDETEAVAVRVRFHFPQSLWADRNGLGELEAAEAGGAQVRRFQVTQVDAFLRWLLTQQGEAEPLDPPEVVEAFRGLARQVAELYVGAAAGGAGPGPEGVGPGPGGVGPGPGGPGPVPGGPP
ncbi:MAG TPA: WYL domain-containing protein [Longimicrobiales bacterium]|nr:WYL domain-containing protein [Longimicrobiales bacterium]